MFLVASITKAHNMQLFCVLTYL